MSFVQRLTSISSRTAPTRALTQPSLKRNFHQSIANMVLQAGDPIPSVKVKENGPGDVYDISEKLASGKGLIIGVPAAFSPSCSETHVPGYINSEKTKNAGTVMVVSVNDAFVMKAWKKNLDPDNKANIHFVADDQGNFTKAIGMELQATPMLGNTRSKRYAMTTQDGKIVKVHIEPDGTGVNESAVDKVLA